LKTCTKPPTHWDKLSFEPTTFQPNKQTQTYARILIVESKENKETISEEVGCGNQEEPQSE
jgi:hypothetical protein